MPLGTADLQRTTTVRTHDGLDLAATVVTPAHESRHAALLLHSEGSTRDQDGVYTRLANELAEHGVASLRVDLPGHGDSEGSQDELSLSTLLNTITVALTYLREHVMPAPASLIATGFTGGVAAGYAARVAPEVDRLVLLNPLIDYQEHFVDAHPAQAATGHVQLSPAFAVGRPMLNEVFWLQPRGVLPVIAAPTLIVHGAGPTTVPLSSSRTAAASLTCPHRLEEISGPQEAHWQAPTIRVTTEWILSGH